MTTIKTAEFQETTQILLDRLGYGVIKCGNVPYDRGIRGHIQYGISANGDRKGTMKAIHELFLAEGWVFANSCFDDSTISGSFHTIFIKGDKKISFYYMATPNSYMSVTEGPLAPHDL